MRHVKKAPKFHAGPIHSAVAGRTDHLPMKVAHGSYVLPAQHVSHLGESNTLAGFKVLRRVFSGIPYGGKGGPYGKSSGPYDEPLADGGAPDGVEIVAAGGEYVLTPEEVAWAGNGDIHRGHRVLDEWIKRAKADHAKTLEKLPLPAQD